MPYIRLPDGTFKRINDGTPVDSSLSLKGAAADAKAVGEKLNEKIDKEKPVAQANSNYSARQMRNVILVAEGEDIPSGQNGDICLVYEV